MPSRIIKERRYKAGYVIRTEEWYDEYWMEPDQTMIIKTAYNNNGEYIGDSKWAHRLIVKRGIMPELIDEERNVCSIGFCERDRRWYGWSHRALCGFGIGDQLFDETWENPNWVADVEDVPFILRGEKVIETLEEARQAAVNFAQYVS